MIYFSPVLTKCWCFGIHAFRYNIMKILTKSQNFEKSTNFSPFSRNSEKNPQPSLQNISHLISRPGFMNMFYLDSLLQMAFLLSKLFNLSPAESLYLVMVGCCPAGANSNMFCLVSHGEITLSFVVTFMSTFMCMGLESF